MDTSQSLVLVYHPKSSHITSATYDPSTQILSTTFHNNRTYQHVIPPLVWENFQRYRSAGEYFHGIIRKYPQPPLSQPPK